MRALVHYISVGWPPSPPDMRRITSATRPDRARRLRSALRAAFRVFRGVVRSPIAEQSPKAGSRVVSSKGRRIGLTGEVLIGVHSGKTAIAVVEDGPPARRLMFVSSESLRTHEGIVVVPDETLPRQVFTADSPSGGHPVTSGA